MSADLTEKQTLQSAVCFRPCFRWGCALLLGALLCALIYHPVGHYGFLNFDDDLYLSGNPWLKRGLGWASLRWAFLANLTEFSNRAEYWSPLTLLSRLLDAQFFGVQAGAFHVTSAVLHLANGLLLGVALYRLTGRWGRSAAVAALFLAHPLNVEPVCWLSARKDLLSATFFFVTLIAYASYVREPNRKRYALLLLAFLAALMAKPMAITIPLVLLALDWWPLGRWAAAEGRRREQLRLLAEKLPLLMLAVAGAILAVVSQKDWGALQTTGVFPLWLRAENAIVSYALYLRRLFWPSDLAIYYPHPGFGLSKWSVALALTILLSVTALAWRLRRSAPYVGLGWLWFGVVLGPVIGLVQVGNQALADRYAYPSLIGLFIALVWAGASFLEAQPQWRRAGSAAAATALVLWTASSMRQVRFWRDSETAFAHDVAVTRNNSMAYLNLGYAFFERGALGKADECYRQSLKIAPGNPTVWSNLARVEAMLGHQAAAVQCYHETLALQPDNVFALLFLGRMLKTEGRTVEAEAHLRRVFELEPSWPQPGAELGELYATEGRWREAAKVWATYLAAHPGDPTAEQRLVQAETAIGESQTADPAFPSAAPNL